MKSISQVLTAFFRANPHRSIHSVDILQNSEMMFNLVKELASELPEAQPEVSLMLWAKEHNSKIIESAHILVQLQKNEINFFVQSKRSDFDLLLSHSYAFGDFTHEMVADWTSRAIDFLTENDAYKDMQDAE